MAHPQITRMFVRRTVLLATAVGGVLTLGAGALVAGAARAAAADTATINGATTFQTITGFGASEAFGEAQTVMNASSSVQQQALTFPGDQKITNAWNGTATQSGEAVTITNASYNGTIAPGGNTSLGFQGTWTNSDAGPAAFPVNGTACTT